MTSAAALPGRTYECIPCEQTYLAGARSGPGPFYCHDCEAVLTLRPEGAEPYAGGAVVEQSASIASLPLFAQEQP